MASQQVLAFGVSCKGDCGENAATTLPALGQILRPIHPALQPRVFGEKAFLVIPDHYAFEDYYNAFTVQYQRLAEQHHNLLLHFHLALASGPDYESAKTTAHDLLTAIITETTETATDVVLYITRDVYNSLPPHYRDNYHSSTRMGNITAHRRFKEGGLDCFVVSPIGEEDDKIRRRADFVFERYIKPACEATNYRARRSDMIVSKGISKEMKTRLTESPMVVVYVGSPKYGWNPNVIWEFGFREGKGKPCILLKDRTVDGKRYNMPFDIADFRFIDIPEDEREETTDDDYGSYIRKIREFIEWQNEPIDQADQCTYWHAGLTLQFGGGRVKIVEEKGDIADLIDLPSIHHKGFRKDIIPHLLAHMPEIQAAAFKKQQMELIGSILWEESPKLHATIPIVFNKHKTKRGRAFLPVIVNHGLFEGLIHVKVIFLEVTGVLKTHDDGYFYCDLAGQPLTDLPRAGDESSVVPLKA